VLIEFTVKNFRSFREQATFSMVSGDYAKSPKTNAFDTRISGLPKLVKSAAIYGPNAAGKTNLLRAIHFVQQFVIGSASAPPGAPITYTPFNFSAATRGTPSEFVVSFVEDKVRYEYGFKINASRVLEEWLLQYVTNRGRLLFDRIYDKKASRYRWKFSSFLKGRRSVWSETTRENSLFLSNASQLNSEQLLPVFQWFQKRLVVVMPGLQMNAGLTIQLLDKPGGKERLLPFLREADLGISDIFMAREIMPATGGAVFSGAYIEQRPNAAPSVVTITFKHRESDEKGPPLPLSDESSGTQILFATAGAWLNVFANGEVLLIDEIDTSLHLLLTQFLIRKFHSTKTNPKNAQLIFTTHNTSLLDEALLGRDQVWFVEKDLTGGTKLFSLGDFKVRKDEAFEKSYLKGRYGALPVLDASET
jgi:AAA15 family ATPase/GTPase